MQREMESLRSHIGELLNKVENENVIVMDADLAKSTTTADFRDKNPNRFVECGISETSAMGIASGLAMEGKIPIYVNFSIFLIGSAYTQLRQACYANLNIKLIGTHPGLDDGPDGASHHANEDIALSRVLPNLKILIPSSIKELKECIDLAVKFNGPVFIRCSRDLVPVISNRKPYEVKFGKFETIYDDGDDITIICEGTAATVGLDSFEKLKDKGYMSKLINISSIKPVDKEGIIKLALNSKLMITIENHTILGGLGGLVAEVLSEMPKHAPLIRIGVNDIFTESGNINEIKEKYGISASRVLERVDKILNYI